MANDTQTIVQQQNLPQWYQDYLQNVIGRAQGNASMQAPIYNDPNGNPLPRIANMTPQQLQAMAGVSNMQGAETPYLNQAAQGYQTALDNSQSIWSPGFDQGLGYAQDASGYGQSASGYGQAALGYGQAAVTQGSNAINSGLGAAQGIYAAQQPYLQQAQGMIGQGTSQNLLGLANPYIQQAVQGPGMGLMAASPFLSAASQSLPDATMNNMSPYIGGAMNALSNQAAYDLQNKYLPAVNDSFIHAGQFGSTRNQDITAQTIHDTQQNVLNQQAQMLNQGYGQAGQLAQSNLGLQGQLAQIAGGLGSAQQQALLGAGSTLGTLGGAQAGLQLQGAGQTAGLGSQAANALGQQAQLGIQGGTALGNLNLGAGQLALGAGNLDLGAGNLNVNAGNLANSIANNRGNLALGASQAANNAATGLTNYANTAQNMNLSQLNALYSSGSQQQNLNQQNLNTAYNDWLNQTFYPQNQTSWLSNIVRGLPSTGAGQTTNYSTPTNTGAQVGGLLTAAMGAAGAGGAGQAVTGAVTGYAARGGAVRFKRGGRVSYRNGSNDNAPLRGIGHYQKVA